MEHPLFFGGKAALREGDSNFRRATFSSEVRMVESRQSDTDP
jgi:hypothetical protein